MKDFRQLIRWAMPGFICLAFGITLWVTEDAKLRGGRLWELIEGSDTRSTVNIIGGIVGIFAVVTALGFLLSIVHHVLLHSVYPGWLIADLRQAIRVSGLQLRNFKGRIITSEDITTSGAWIVVNVVWHASMGATNNRIASADLRTQSLYDFMHGAGATFIGILSAVIIVVLYDGIYNSDGKLNFISLGLSVFVLFIAFWNLRSTAKRAEAVTGGLFVDVLQESMPKTTWVDEELVCSSKWKRQEKKRIKQEKKSETHNTTAT